MMIPKTCPICNNETHVTEEAMVRFECGRCVHDERTPLFYGLATQNAIIYFCVKKPMKEGFLLALYIAIDKEVSFHYIVDTNDTDNRMREMFCLPGEILPDEAFKFLNKAERLLAFI